MTQTFEILQVASKCLGTQGGKHCSARIRAGETEHFVARTNQFVNDGGTDEARSSCEKYTHVFLLVRHVRAASNHVRH